MIELFWYPGTCARVPFIALEEIGAKYETRLVRLLDRDERAAAAMPAAVGRVPLSG